MKTLASLAIILTVFTLASCVKDKEETTIQHYTDAEYATLVNHLDLPRTLEAYFPGLTVNEPFFGFVPFGSQNDKATLGRVLFYDKRLSANNTISCANCHKQELAFSDDVALSEGFQGELTARNSIALGSVKDFQTSYDGGGSSFGKGSQFFWDDRAATIIEQSTETIQNPIEMGTNLDELGDELLKEDFYRILFDKAFHQEKFIPAKEKILIALQEFCNAMSSANSKFDTGINAHGNPMVDFNNLTVQENLGKNLFVQNCATCHGADMRRVEVATASNGLDEVYADKGVGAITGKPSDDGVFKVPMLRNIALTGPYMHDGRFATLQDVVEHYSSDIKNHANLSDLLKTGNQPKHLNLTQTEKDALVAFLNTLTDVSTIMKVRFSDPFK